MRPLTNFAQPQRIEDVSQKDIIQKRRLLREQTIRNVEHLSSISGKSIETFQKMTEIASK